MLRSLSPRRRLFLTASGSVVALLAVAGVFVAVHGNRSSVGSAAQGSPGPILLIPGFGGNRASLDELATRLRTAGRDVTIVGLPDGATGDFVDQAKALGSAVDSARARTEAQSVDLVGYSDGGIVARLYVRDDGGGSQVRRVVTLGTPNHGTRLASSADALGSGVCSGACAQVLPGSSFLNDLNSGAEKPKGPLWLSLWTSADATVTPPETARLDGAVNVVVQDVCADDRVGHGGLPQDPMVIGLVVQSLGVGPLAQPTSSDCGPLRALGATR